MRVVRFMANEAEQPQWGVLEGLNVVAATGDPFSAPGLRATDAVALLESVTLLPPVRPGKIVCVGLNYLAHVTERDPTRRVPEEPVLFMKPPSSLLAAGQPIRVANLDHRTDHEAELALVIGKTARRVSEADALSYVWGFTAANDVSDRDLQKKDGQWVRAKGFDTYCPLGPWIETELDVSDVPVRSRVNGELRQDQTTASMIWSPSALIAFISGVMTLEPGDVILTGTPEGVGPLLPGDVVDVEIGGIGVLSNPVVAAD
jgi:2-keto-4-pentenoate hydratase/2-oxohepta-3-ene-1,7-dioic acid hydratase in catechol pathway